MKFRKTVFLFLFLLSAFSGTQVLNAAEKSKPRVIVMTDGEVDDRCSMIRFLLHTNDVQVLGIIQTNSVYQRKGWSSSKWLDRQIDAYEQVYKNLIVHDPSYPAPDELRAKVFVGDEDSSHVVVDRFSNLRIPGMIPVIDPAGWEDTPGSNKIVEVLLENDPSPVYIQAWGGGNTAARAFHKLKTQYPKDYERAVSKVVMYNIWYQDGAGSYIEKYHPAVTMLLSHYFSGTWDYGSMAFTHTFVENEVKHNHGPLGALYPQDYISEGDSPAFLFTLGDGLRAYENPTWGGWGGRFYKVDGFENMYRDIDKGSYQRWIEYANRDFKTRLDWCVAGKFNEANHRPVIQMHGELERIVKSGDLLELEATVSDPDSLNAEELWNQNSELYTQAGMNKESFANYVRTLPKTNALWWQFKEAGTYNGMVKIENPTENKIQFFAPEVETAQTIHLILEVKDRGVPALTSFARVIVTVVPE